jgi:putative flippase GtrA
MHIKLPLVAFYHQLPEQIRLVCTAILGAGIGWVTYEIIYWLNPLDSSRATTSWALAFLIGVARQHALHRTLTFTHHSPYWRSLGRAYLFYSVSTLLGAALNYTLTNRLGLHHRLAWLACLGLTACISMLFLKRLVFRDINR